MNQQLASFGVELGGYSRRAAAAKTPAHAASDICCIFQPYEDPNQMHQFRIVKWKTIRNTPCKMIQTMTMGHVEISQVLCAAFGIQHHHCFRKVLCHDQLLGAVFCSILGQGIMDQILHRDFETHESQ